MHPAHATDRGCTNMSLWPRLFGKDPKRQDPGMAPQSSTSESPATPRQAATLSLAEAITSITIEAQRNCHVDLTSADAVLSAVSDSLELGLWIAEFLPDQ